MLPSAASTVEASEIGYEESDRGHRDRRRLATDFGWRRRDDGAGKVVWFILDILATDDH